MQKDDILYYEYSRLDPERTIDGVNFDNGEILYKKSMPTAANINLARSYMKLTVTIDNNAGAAQI